MANDDEIYESDEEPEEGGKQKGKKEKYLPENVSEEEISIKEKLGEDSDSLFIDG